MSKLERYTADQMTLALEALDAICALEDEEHGYGREIFLLNKAISIAGNARLSMAYRAEDAIKDGLFKSGALDI